eukprot:TRINITY_DN29613_c0_g1_i1.p1 TRINITY_DN29613_c0_g1~~TRINITY_DN29613_c0_g1_i1.p1  ORF type:complete len:139 (+),score=31.94 TRINITY_DN29613_c0_g1_i1:176-592(+)
MCIRDRYLCDPFSLLTTSLHTNQPPLLYFGQCLSEGGMNSGGGAATSAEEEDPPLWRWDTSIHYAMFTNTPPHGGGSGGSHTHTSATIDSMAVSYTHLRAHETPEHLVCRLLLEKKKPNLSEPHTITFTSHITGSQTK